MEKTLQKNLKKARAVTGWTLAEAEEKTGIKSVTIGSYERGYRLPPLDVLVLLADHYGVTVGWLIGESE